MSANRDHELVELLLTEQMNIHIFLHGLKHLIVRGVWRREIDYFIRHGARVRLLKELAEQRQDNSA